MSLLLSMIKDIQLSTIREKAKEYHRYLAEWQSSEASIRGSKLLRARVDSYVQIPMDYRTYTIQKCEHIAENRIKS